MSRNALTVVFPAAVALLVCSLVVLFLTATGLEPGPSWAAEEEPALGCGVVDKPVVVRTQDASQSAALGIEEKDIVAGADLFKANCAQCHAVNDVVVGPALAGIDKRRPLPWITKWVRNSSKMVASGDVYGVRLFNQYQKQQMPSFQLSEEQIIQIVKYVKSEEGMVVVNNVAAISDADNVVRN